MIDILAELENFIKEFNLNNDDFDIDSIRIEFSKQHKISKLKELGKWTKLQKSSNILHKLKKRLNDDEVTSAHQLEKYNIYYYNQKELQYRKAYMVIFGLKQYDKAPPPREIIKDILQILKSVSNIDVCIDLAYKPNMKALYENFDVKQYIHKNGVATETFYINDPNIIMLEKIVIYNKGFKNELNRTLYRIEALITIPNIKYLSLPLFEFKQIVDLARVTDE